AIRLFALEEAVSELSLVGLLGEELTGRAQESGLVVPADGGFRSPFRLEIVNHLYVFADRVLLHEDSVMPVGESTLLLIQSSYPQEDVREALDLGCGNGVVALLLAGCSGRVVATDANPRALAFARFNCAVNGVENVELRLGDLFEPVAGERFDLIVSQPPFCARPSGTPPILFLHGGSRGDEITRRVLTRMAPHLAPGGRGILLSDFPSDGGASLASTLRGLVPELEASLLVLSLSEVMGAETHCAQLAANREPSDDEAFSRELEVLRSHFEDLDIPSLRQAVVVVARNGPGPGWTREIGVAADSWRTLHRVEIDRVLRTGVPGPGTIA
ncbi:MAG TPA: class I SAM-dependent methyltransferase, partial [Thermoanaerobaculia bacterium]|nr:class I SAM-dependent methyltransferase [Thermoanaerobaculia bacterium]